MVTSVISATQSRHQICKGKIIFLQPFSDLRVPEVQITAQILEDGSDRTWQPSYIENSILTQFPLRRTQLNIPPEAFAYHPQLKRLMDGKTKCLCDSVESQRNDKEDYFPFVITFPFVNTMYSKEEKKYPFEIYLAQSIDDDGIILVDWK